MGTSITSLSFRILSKYQPEGVKAAREDIKRLNEDVEAQKASFSKAFSVIGAASGLALGVGLALSLKKALDVEDVTAQLKVAIANSGSSFDAWAGKIDATDNAMAKLGFGVSDVDQSVTTLTRSTQNAGLALSAQSAVADLARAKNISLTDAATQLAKASEGQARAIKGLGVTMITGSDNASALKTAHKTLTDQIKNAGGVAAFAAQEHLSLANAHKLLKEAAAGSIGAFNQLGFTVLPKTATQADKLSQIIDVMNQRLGGSAAAAADTATGKMQAMKAEMGNLGVQIGDKLVPPFLKLLDYLNRFLQNKPALIAFAATLAIFAAGWLAVSVSAAIAGGAMKTALVGSGVGIIIAAIGVAVYLLITHWQEVKRWAEIAWTAVLNALKVAWDWIKQYWPLLLVFLIGPFALLVFWVKNHWSEVLATIKAVGDNIVKYWHDFTNALTTAWRDTWNVVSAIAQGVWSIIGPPIKLGLDILLFAFKAFSVLLQVAWAILWTLIKTIAIVTWDLILVGARAFGVIFGAVFSVVSAVFITTWNAMFALGRLVWTGMSALMHVVFGALGSWWSGFWNGIKIAAQLVWTGLVAGWQWMTDHAKTIFNAFRDSIKSITDKIGIIWNGLKALFAAPIKFFVETVYNNGLRKGWNNTVGKIPGVPQMPPVTLPAGFATGGRFSGYGSGTSDSNLVHISDGEYIINAATTKRHLSFLNALNFGKLRGFAVGGPLVPGSTSAPLGGDSFSATGGPGYNAGPLTGVGRLASGVISWGASVLKDLGKPALEAILKPITALINSMAGRFGGSGEWAKVPGHAWSGTVGKLVDFAVSKMLDVSKLIGGGGGGGSTAAGSGVARLAQAYAATRIGEIGGDMNSLIKLWNQESGWNPNAVNPSSGAYGIPQCHTTDTKILTRRGWLAHDEVVAGDETIGYNPFTGRSEWTKVTEVLHPGVAEVWAVGNGKVRIKATPNHRFLVDSPGRAEGFVELRDHRTRDRLILSREADITEGLDITLQEAALLAWIAGDGWQERAKVSRRKTPDRGRRNHHRPMTYHVAQTKQEHWDAISAAVGDGGRVTRTRERLVNGEPRRDREWRLSAPYARDLTARSGNPKTESLSIVLRMSSAQRKAWLSAMIAAEGHVAPDAVQISQKNGDIAEAIKLAVYLEGYRPGLYQDTRSDVVTIHLSQPYVGDRGYAGLSIGYDSHAEVWCVRTGNGSWTAEQGGHIFLTGNSLGHGHPYNLGDWHAQVDWGIDYIKGRYRTASAAWAHEVANNWYRSGGLAKATSYDTGGYLPTGLSLAYNGTGKPEAVGGVGSAHIEFRDCTFVGASKQQFEDLVVEASNDAKRKGRL